MLDRVGLGDLYAGWTIFWTLVLGLAAFIFTRGSWQEVAQMIGLAVGVALFLGAVMAGPMYLVLHL